MLKKLLITLVTSAVVLSPISVKASELGDRQDEFINSVKNIMTEPKTNFTDDPLAVMMITRYPWVRQITIKYAIDYCLAKSKGEAKQEDKTKLRYIDSSMDENDTPTLKGAFKSLYIASSVVANHDMCP